MKKRLRKKHHRGEFCQLGFSVEAKFVEAFSPSNFNTFMDAFLSELIEPSGLLFGGGGSPGSGWSGVIQQDHRYASTTQEHQAKVSGWLRARPEILAVKLSPLWDIQHGPDPFDQEQNRSPG
jgi:uncharacterized protein